MANITEFKSRLSGGGARSNQFKVMLTFPGFALTDLGGGDAMTSDLSFLCTASTLPGQTLTATTVKFRGRELKLSGDARTFTDWSFDVLNDTSFKIYKAFESWMNGMNNMSNNTGFVDPDVYQSVGHIHQLDREGEPIHSFKFIGCFPIKLGDIPVDYDSDNKIESFTVDLAYQWFETERTT